MEDDLPSDYDVIVVGTGMVESIVAAAASRIDKKVLHIDGNSYYGHFWATFNFDNFEQWFDRKTVENKNEHLVNLADEGCVSYKTRRCELSLDNLKWEWSVNTSEIDESLSKNNEDNEDLKSNVLTRNDIKKKSQKFNIDLSPRILLSKGPMVELLIRSEVSRYTEFTSVHNVLLYINSTIESVPYSKADVFSTRAVSVVEKRILMKLLQEIQNFDVLSLEENDKKTFYEYLRSFQLPDNIEQYILYTIARVSKETPCADGIEAAQLFLKSLGVYGNSPFLWPLYGSSELVQAFCRLCAVYGGIYCLNRGADHIIINEDKCIGILSNNKKLLANHIVMSSSEAPSELFKEQQCETISRGILITNKSVYSAGKKGATLLQYPSESASIPPTTVIELDHTALACPEGFCLVHLIKKGVDRNYEEFNKIIKELFESNENKQTLNTPSENKESNDCENEAGKPKVLFKLFFNLTENVSPPTKPTNLHLCPGPVQFEMDFFSSLQTAENIFKDMFPDEEFLPAPTEVSRED